MGDFDLLMQNALPGIVISLSMGGIGWFLVRRRLISETFAKWIVYPLSDGVFAFFLFGYTFPNLSPLSRLLVTVIVWATALGMSLTIARAW